MKVVLSKNAQKDYTHLPKPAQVKVKKKLTMLVSDASGKPLEGELKGYYSIRAWPYRIIYSVNKKENRIEVHKIAHRQGVYR